MRDESGGGYLHRDIRGGGVLRRSGPGACGRGAHADLIAVVENPLDGNVFKNRIG